MIGMTEDWGGGNGRDLVVQYENQVLRVVDDSKSDPYDWIWVTRHLSHFHSRFLQDMVQGLVNQLLEEAAKQATQKGFCESAMGKATKERDRRLREAKKLNLGANNFFPGSIFNGETIFAEQYATLRTKPKVKHTIFQPLNGVFLVEIQIQGQIHVSW